MRPSITRRDNPSHLLACPFMRSVTRFDIAWDQPFQPEGVLGEEDHMLAMQYVVRLPTRLVGCGPFVHPLPFLPRAPMYMLHCLVLLTVLAIWRPAHQRTPLTRVFSPVSERSTTRHVTCSYFQPPLLFAPGHLSSSTSHTRRYEQAEHGQEEMTDDAMGYEEEGSYQEEEGSYQGGEEDISGYGEEEGYEDNAAGQFVGGGMLVTASQ